MHAHQLVDFTRLIEARAELTQTVVAIGAGLRLAVRARGGAGRAQRSSLSATS